MDSSSPTKHKGKLHSLIEIKAAQYGHKLELPDEPTIDRYFSVSAQEQYNQTYRQLLHHADLLRGGRRELHAIVKDSRDPAALFQKVDEKLAKLGVITPSHSVSATPTNSLKKTLSATTTSMVPTNGTVRPHTAGPKLQPVQAPSRRPVTANASKYMTERMQRIAINSAGKRERSRASSARNAIKSTNDANHSEEEDDDLFDGSLDISYRPSSPRAVFLAGCVKQGLPPRSIAMLRKRISPVLNLAHMSLGDPTALILADALDKMPYLQTLNLADNALSDVGLSAIINSVSRHSTLEILDLSQNVINRDASKALADYIGNENCFLKCLRMSNADIDDKECARFVEVLMNNRMLLELDMSNNLLGKDENLNVVMPDFLTGGESLAKLIRASHCPLQTLNLHWNMIRLEGAAVLCDSIRHNNYLTNLNLSYNALGTNSVCILGAALLDNHMLQHLNLANNNIDSVGAITLATGLRENASLRDVVLDGNPIGEQGARAIMKVTIQHGHRLHITTQDCDLTTKSSTTKLKMESPIGEYLLNLSESFERAIAFELFDTVAADRNIEMSICELYLSSTMSSSASLASATSRPSTAPGKSVKSERPHTASQTDVATHQLGPLTASYTISRFDEPRPHELLMPEERAEEEFFRALSPIADMSTATILRTVRKYDAQNTDTFFVEDLRALFDDLLLHQGAKKTFASSTNNATLQKERLQQFFFTQQIDDSDMLTAAPKASTSTTGHHAKNHSRLSMDKMIQGLVEDARKLLDPRNAGIIDNDIFVEYIYERAKGARERLRHLLNIPRCTATLINHNSSSSPSMRKGLQSTSLDSLDSWQSSMAGQQSLRYIPPIRGWLRLKVVEAFTIHSPHDEDEPSDEQHKPKSTGYALTKSMCLKLIDEVKKMCKSQPMALLLYALDCTWLRLEEAQLLYVYARQHSDDSTAMLARILLRMQSGFEARRLVQFAVGDDIMKLRRLKQRLGCLYYPLLHMYSGFYTLDLSNVLDRACLKRLIEKSAYDTENRRKQGFWDTSQHGHWSCFRNEYHRNIVADPVSTGPFMASTMGSTASVAPSTAGNGGAAAGGGSQTGGPSGLLSGPAAFTTPQSYPDASVLPENLISPRLFSPIPNKGRVQFDFVNIVRPSASDCFAVNQDVILDCLLLSRLLAEDEVDWAIQRLQNWKQDNRRSMVPDGNPPYRADLGRAHAIGDHLHAMYSSLAKRPATRKKAFLREAIKSVAVEANAGNKANKRRKKRRGTASFSGVVTYASHRNSISISSSFAAAVGKGAQSNASSFAANSVDENELAEVEESDAVTGTTGADEALDETEKAVQNTVAALLGANSANPNAASGTNAFLKAKEVALCFRSFSKQGHKAKHKMRMWGDRLQEIVVDGRGSDEHKASALLEYFEAELGSYWLECRYLALVAELWAPIGMVSRSHIGSYRVELIVLLFDRIIDLHNFEVILSVLNAEEHASLIARLGFLNLFNPNKCEGGWFLNMGRWEERQAVKMLIHLSVIEPGQNWYNTCYNFLPGLTPVPAWDLNRNWLTEDGLPTKGTVSFEMYAGEGLRKHGCSLDLVLRQLLCALTLVPQRNFVAEVMNAEGKKPLLEETSSTSTTTTTTPATVAPIQPSPFNPFKRLVKKTLKTMVIPKKDITLSKLKPQIDILRQLCHGTGTEEERRRHEQRLRRFERRLEEEHVRNKELHAVQFSDDPLDDHYHDVLHYTIEDCNDHLAKEMDCKWNYTSATRKPEVWV